MEFDAVPVPPPDPSPVRRVRGDTVALRSIRDFPGHGIAVGFAVAGIVIADDDDVVVVCTTRGSGKCARAGRRSGSNGRLLLPSDWDGGYDERPWDGDTVVRVHRWGERWSVWRWYDGTGWTDRWYGNLESPWQRSAIGYDTQDWTLDVVARGVPASPGWSVEYKDEDELAWKVEHRLITPALAESVRRVGEQLTEVAVAAQWPFDADWDAWLPDREWGAARLHGDWRAVSPS